MTKTPKKTVLKTSEAVAKTSEAVSKTSEAVARTSKPVPKLVILEKPITIREVTKEEIEEAISPKPKKREETKEKKIIKLSTKKVEKPELSIEQREDESNEDFMMRKAYTLAAEKVFPNYPSSTYILLGDMGVKRAKYNMTYPKETDIVLDHIDKHILNQ